MSATLFPEVAKAAALSECGTYRYKLTRRWADGPLLTFIMLNPSTADAEVDDPTIRRCMGFARREGMAGIVVANRFALRSPNPAVLSAHRDPFGPANHDALAEVVDEAQWTGAPIICAWGAYQALDFENLPDPLCNVMLRCLGKTKHGAPRHPLYVRADQPLEAWP